MRCCAITLANKQPETVNGSPESIMDRGVRRAVKITGSWVDEIAEAVEGLGTSKEIREALRRIEQRLDQSELEGALAEADLQSGLLGALDAHYEAETEDIVAPAKFSGSEFVYLLEERARSESGGRFASRGIDHAVGFFERLEVLQVNSLIEAREWLDEYSVRHAFWVSGLVKKRMLQDVRKELSRQIAKGSDLRTFRKFVKARLESAGWTPKNRSHVETVFRTNVLKSYGAGRAKQMRHPSVIKARPYWRITGVKDNRTRETHRAVQGWILLASDAAWLEAYPPFGMNCRCRVTSRRNATVVRLGSELLRYVPDLGFRSGLPSLPKAA